MSSVTVIVGIVVLLAALVCYAFVSQSMQQKAEQRKRLLAALKSQHRSFSFILSGCPDGFLTKELKTIVLRSLIEVSEQLTRIDPKEPQHAQNLKQFTQTLAEVQREAPTSAQVSIENPQQIKEIKMSLEELHRFVFKLEEQQRVTRNQADGYRSQIKQLVLRVTVDGYMLHGHAARQSQKAKLALHYYDLALKLLIREGKAGSFDQKIQQLRELIKNMTEKLTEEEAAAPIAMEDGEESLGDEWSKFSEEASDDIWKKKQFYD